MAAFGVGGYALVCAYFIVGSAVTKIKLKEKQAEGIAEARGGLRGPGSVWGSGDSGDFVRYRCTFGMHTRVVGSLEDRFRGELLQQT